MSFQLKGREGRGGGGKRKGKDAGRKSTASHSECQRANSNITGAVLMDMKRNASLRKLQSVFGVEFKK